MDRRGAVEETHDGPLWYKDAIIYELHVKSFFDSDGDGIGDFRGLTQKLDYLQDLGVTALWLLPFYPSPLRDDGYDIADYTGVHPSYGNLRDVRVLVREAHRRGLKVINELVANHTSDQHPWFQRARRAKPGSAYRDFYVWNDTDQKYTDTRIIFQDFEASNWTWDDAAQAFYWHRFYHHQPDLNFDNPRVHDAIFRALDYWFEMGFDGTRLDAIPYLYEREGTNCENLPETHAFLKKLRRHVDEHHENRMLLAEANMWPEDSAAYFGEGDECHMAFHFPVMPRLFMAVRMEDRHPIIDILDQTPAIPETSQWALFLRNHDELTLEMVTGEERDYMIRSYAHDPEARINLGIRRRLSPLMNNNRRRIELMNGLLLSLPGTPVLYYGDEIGMGDNFFLGDRDGVRTPMQWSGDRNAGFSTANRQRLYLPVNVDPEYHYETVNVETQQANPQSLLWWMKRIIALRKRYHAFGRGDITFLEPENRKILAYIRTYQDEQILVVANLSRFVQAAELDLSAWHGQVPVEMFGRTEFPPIGELPYFITLGPHSFYWFSIEPLRTAGDFQPLDPVEVGVVPALSVAGSWEGLTKPRSRSRLERVILGYLAQRRWFGGKARQPKTATIIESVPVPFDSRTARLLLIQVDYTEGDSETYQLPIMFAGGERADQVRDSLAHAAIAEVTAREGQGVLYDVLWEPGFPEALLDFIARRRNLTGTAGSVNGTPTRVFRRLRGSSSEPLSISVSGAEQSNTSVIYGDTFILKLFRKVQPGINPDLELGRYLTEEAGFKHTAPVAGSLEYQTGRGEPSSLAILHGYVHNEGDAWAWTLDMLGRYFEQVVTLDQQPEEFLPVQRSSLGIVDWEIPEMVDELVGPYLDLAQLLGERTAEMHRAFGAATQPPMRPEPFGLLYQRSLYQSMRSQANSAFRLLRRTLPSLGDGLAEDARLLLDREAQVNECLQAINERKFDGQRTRLHGDYHLGQVLFTGRDFVIIDFEGEPARPLGERRLKGSPLIDVAGMLRSFHYAANANLFNVGTGAPVRPEDVPVIEKWAEVWRVWVSATFLKRYLSMMAGSGLLPDDRAQLRTLLDCYVLTKAIYELSYELNNRPEWVPIPTRGILELLEV
jgi:maltose alpha-D-glucosyltransferase/alpha-amylase